MHSNRTLRLQGSSPMQDIPGSGNMPRFRGAQQQQQLLVQAEGHHNLQMRICQHLTEASLMLLLPLLLLLQMRLRRQQQLERRRWQIQFWVPLRPLERLHYHQEQQLGRYRRYLYIYARRRLLRL